MSLYQPKTLSPKKIRRGARGFTLLELLIVISIIGILASIVLPTVTGARKKAYYSRSLQEFKSVHTALEYYASDIGTYPPDSTRDLPAGIEQYLGPGVWPKAPYPNSVYDWDNWAPSDLAYPPQQQVYQISIRFCTAPGVCAIPNEPWAAGFDYYSALYYCILGPCRSHSSQPVDYPGKRVN